MKTIMRGTNMQRLFSFFVVLAFLLEAQGLQAKRTQINGPNNGKSWVAETKPLAGKGILNTQSIPKISSYRPGVDTITTETRTEVLSRKGVAIIQNFANPEIDTLRSYLAEMGLAAKIFPKETVTLDSLLEFELIIYDDVSFSRVGIRDTQVFMLEQAFDAGIPLYFIGDDLGILRIYLSASAAIVWKDLTHLSASSNFGGGSSVMIKAPSHPVINGPFGVVDNFGYPYLDIDTAIATRTGEMIIASSENNTDVILAFEDSTTCTRTVTQNILTYNGGDAQSVSARKKLFKNAVAWLLDRCAGAPLECEVTITSPQDSVSLCADSVKVAATLNVTGGNPPYDDTTCTINGVPSSVQPDGTILAIVPLLPGENEILIVATVIDAGLVTIAGINGASKSSSAGSIEQAVGRDSILVFSDPTVPLATFDFSQLPLITGQAVDSESGIAQIEIVETKNRIVLIDPFTPGDKHVSFRSERTQPQGRSGFLLKITNMAGCEILVDPAYVRLDPMQDPVQFTLPPTDRYLFVNNQGLTRIAIKINQHEVNLISSAEGRGHFGDTYYMPFEGTCSIDLLGYFGAGENEFIVSAFGPEEASADFLITDFRVDETGTGVSDGNKNSGAIPRAFTVAQNYPNPFNPETRVWLEVPEGWTAPVTFHVFNLQGQLLQILIDGVLPPGQHLVVWNARTAGGQALPSGVYFYQIRSGDFVAVRKMLLAK